MSQGHLTLPLSHEIPFDTYSLLPGSNRSLHIFLIPFSICGVQWGTSVKYLNLDFTLYDVWFPIPPPHICIQHNLDSQWWGWLLPTLILPLMIASETPDNPSRDSQFVSPSTFQTNCTISVAGMSVHNIVPHNRDVYLYNYLSVKWVPNQPKVASYNDSKLVRPPSPCLMTRLSQSLRVVGR